MGKALPNCARSRAGMDGSRQHRPYTDVTDSTHAKLWGDGAGPVLTGSRTNRLKSSLLIPDTNKLNPKQKRPRKGDVKSS